MEEILMIVLNFLKSFALLIFAAFFMIMFSILAPAAWLVTYITDANRFVWPGRIFETVQGCRKSFYSKYNFIMSATSAIRKSGFRRKYHAGAIQCPSGLSG
jgi:hypothetical protein